MKIRRAQKILLENAIHVPDELVEKVLRDQPAIKSPNWYFVEAVRMAAKEADI